MIMRYKGTLILLVLMVVLGLYLYLIELPGQKSKQQEEEKAQKVASFEPSEAVGLYLSYPKRVTDPEILLEKDSEEKWKIVKPIAAPADESEVQGLLSSIGSMRVERVVEEKASDLKVYGLDQPEVTVLLKLKDHEEHLLFGDSAPVGSTLYVMRAGEGTIRLTDQFYKTHLTKTVTDLRKKEVLDFDSQKIKRVSLQYPGQAFVLAKEEGRWWIKKPGILKADDDVIFDLLASLKRLKAKDFVDEGRPDLSKRFKDPRLKVELESESGNPTALSIYEVPGPSQSEQKTFAVTDNPTPIYLIEAEAMTDLRKDLFALRDKHLLDFDPAQVQGIEIRKTAEDPLTIPRQGESWSFEGQVLEGSKSQKISGFLKSLSGLKAEKMVDETPKSENPYGLNPPQFRISLIDSQQATLAELLIGIEKDDLIYARSSSSADIYRIRDQILQDLPGKSDLKKQVAEKPTS